MILRWLLPVGFVGLVAIAILLVVYLLRPQYRQKRISGTVVWKRVVLRTKKQRLMVSNILIFLVQALVLAIIAVGFAEPRLYSQKQIAGEGEYVVVLDASASMRAKSSASSDTRFERAVAGAKREIEEFFSQSDDGTVSLIVADAEPTYLFSDLNKDDEDKIYGALQTLECSLEVANLDDAITLAGKHLESNPHTKIAVFTDTEFGNLGSAVEVVDVCDNSHEQNIAILGCTVGRVQNQFVFELVLGAYGNVTRKCNVFVDIKNADNGDGPRDLHLEVPVNFSVSENSSEQVQRISVVATDEQFGGQADWFFDDYEQAEISIQNLEDAIPDDDRFLVYGGIRDKINVEYCSEKPNGFWQLGFDNLANNMSKTRDITFREIFDGEEPQNAGFDFYIFEHSIPTGVLHSLPKDGIILLVDPDATLNDAGLGISFEKKVSLGQLTHCTAKVEHPLTQYLQPERIGLTEICQVSVEENSLFQPLLFVDDNPVMLLKDTPSSKVIVMPFSINMSDFYGEQFQIFLYNLVNNFLPVTLTSSDFELGDTTQFYCKGETIEVEHNGNAETFSQFPAQFTFRDVGTYTFTTTFGLEKQDEVRRVYVHLATQESNLFPQSDFRINLDSKEVASQLNGQDFFVWLAVASLVLMMIEWFLQFKYIL